ncbi:phage portal protein [Sphingomonas sp. RRHST34]|uniref:Phage portal protein n=1 Tax=Sphingomonas citri TaxID=2862499 RepID=A0ABS7BQN4_9SPHN|nr:phage portal protein [Sphingomonas citri]MBW6531918.1 phage portal protein [Sphingomonas citri]
MKLFGLTIGREPEAMHLPRIQALGNTPYSWELNDPRVADFLRGGRSTASGKTVTERSALSNATFFRAVNLISSAIGMLPVNLLKKTADGAEKDEAHHVQRLLRVRPNDWQTPLQFKAYMQGRALLHGNGYAYKIRSGARVIALVPMDPRRVTVALGSDFRRRYTWTKPNGEKQTLTQDDVLHLAAPYSSDGITGDALLNVAAEALGLADTADEAAARLLRNGAYVGGALKHPKNMSREAILRLREQFEERYSGTENAGKWLVLEEGLDAQAFGINGQQAQGLEQRKHQAEEVSRFTGVPRPLLMFDETSWGSGIEVLGIFLVTYCLQPWFTAWEEAIERSLLTEAEQATHDVKFNAGALLRGSLKDQAEILSKMIGGPGAAGWGVPNEARDMMDMNRQPWGDTPAWQTPEVQDDPQP